MGTIWQRELRARLEDDPRFTPGRSRVAKASAYFSGGRELLRFLPEREDGVFLRLGREGILLLGPAVGDPRFLEVAFDWVLVRVESEEDLAFLAQWIDRAIMENGPRKPRGRGLPVQRKRKSGG